METTNLAKKAKEVFSVGKNTVQNKGISSVLQQVETPPEKGELVEGPIAAFGRAAVYIDLAPFGTGVIYGREYINARDLLKNANIGDTIAAKVVERENESGYIELSLKEARQALIWSDAEEAIKNKTVFELPVKDANKGGLLLEWQSIQGFLPASQLSADHYPRVEDGDKDKIFSELKQLIGEKISVQIINAAPKEGKLIFSERGQVEVNKTEIIDKYAVGDEIEGEVTGIVEFGVFVKIEEGLEGLVHISEIDWGLVEDPKDFVRVGESVKAKIIEIKDDKISLSLKALKQNPWADAEKRYEKGQLVNGVVIKFNKHGALISIEEGVAGLVHVSEFGTAEKLRETLELGKTYKFKIALFEPKEHRMTLSYVDKAE